MASAEPASPHHASLLPHHPVLGRAKLSPAEHKAARVPVAAEPQGVLLSPEADQRRPVFAGGRRTRRAFVWADGEVLLPEARDVPSKCLSDKYRDHDEVALVACLRVLARVTVDSRAGQHIALGPSRHMYTIDADPGPAAVEVQRLSVEVREPMVLHGLWDVTECQQLELLSRERDVQIDLSMRPGHPTSLPVGLQRSLPWVGGLYRIPRQGLAPVAKAHRPHRDRLLRVVHCSSFFRQRRIRC